ncbi:MAG: His/Gly/Thr/Pro-type tRNA ligase C-terminal domain-containing protein, partial [Phocaeicola sp.]
IDFHLEDSIGRTWQCGTIQLDMNLPERFDVDYTDKDGSKKRPVMIHRVCFGSIERFIGILIEHFAGQFPTWLSPVQVKVLPISEKFEEYAKSVTEALEEANIRWEADYRAEKIGYKIREARNERVPYIIVVGEKDLEANKVSLRSRTEGDEGQQDLTDVIARIVDDIKTRKNN